jgi:hypothetical protein
VVDPQAGRDESVQKLRKRYVSHAHFATDVLAPPRGLGVPAGVAVGPMDDARVVFTVL